MGLEIVSIIISSCVSVLAITVSIISLNRQTRAQNLQSTIELYDRRIKIYCLLLDIVKMVGYTNGHAGLKKDEPNPSAAELFEFIKRVPLPDDVSEKIANLVDDGEHLGIQARGLFKKELGDYIVEVIRCFRKYAGTLKGLKRNYKIKIEDEENFKHLYSLIKDKERVGVISEINAYIDLSDIKRVDR